MQYMEPRLPTRIHKSVVFYLMLAIVFYGDPKKMAVPMLLSPGINVAFQKHIGG